MQFRCGTTTGREAGLDMVKLEEAIHYICSSVTASDRLGAVKLNKILFYSDMLQFAETGQSITGASYMKKMRGPVPKQVLPAIEDLSRCGRLSYENVSVFDLVRREFTAAGKTNLSVFQPDEIERLSQMIRFVCDFGSASEISEVSHTVVWHAAELGEDLPYETFLVSYLGEADEDTIRQSLEAVNEVELETQVQYA